jgi:hypothetical protein
MTGKPEPPGHTHSVHNGKRLLTIDELAMMQPGMDRLMAEVGPRVHRLYYAAGAGNWPLAEYFLRSVVKQLKLCASSRPKYAGDIERYLTEDVPPIREAIRERSAAAFAAAYTAFVDRANDYHRQYGKGFIRWVTPPEPPPDLDLSADVGG